MPKERSYAQLLAGKKLGIMVAAGPERKNFTHAIKCAEAAIRLGVEVYIYFIDEAVRGLNKAEVQNLKQSQARIFGCAFSLQKRRLPLSEDITMVGLTMLNEIIASTDRFLPFT